MVFHINLKLYKLLLIYIFVLSSENNYLISNNFYYSIYYKNVTIAEFD